jgi:hypothetical protein
MATLRGSKPKAKKSSSHRTIAGYALIAIRPANSAAMAPGLVSKLAKFNIENA